MNKRVSLFTPAFISFFYLIYILDPECILFDGNSRKILHFLGVGFVLTYEAVLESYGQLRVYGIFSAFKVHVCTIIATCNEFLSLLLLVQ